MNFADSWNVSQEDIHFVQQTGIIRFFLPFEQYDVKMLVTSFWDTQYIPANSAKLFKIGPLRYFLRQFQSLSTPPPRHVSPTFNDLLTKQNFFDMEYVSVW